MVVKQHQYSFKPTQILFIPKPQSGNMLKN